MTTDPCCGRSAAYVRGQLEAAMERHEDAGVFFVKGFRVDVRYMDLVPCCPNLVEWGGGTWRLTRARETTDGPWFLIGEYERWS